MIQFKQDSHSIFRANTVAAIVMTLIVTVVVAVVKSTLILIVPVRRMIVGWSSFGTIVVALAVASTITRVTPIPVSGTRLIMSVGRRRNNEDCDRSGGQECGHDADEQAARVHS